MILNLTQHRATPEQIAAGVVDLSDADRASLARALTFDELPAALPLKARAGSIAMMASGCFPPGEPRSAMIGGAPYLMAPLELALWAANIRPLYAFSQRESVEEQKPDGSVENKAVFRHAGFVGLEFHEPRLP